MRMRVKAISKKQGTILRPTSKIGRGQQPNYITAYADFILSKAKKVDFRICYSVENNAEGPVRNPIIAVNKPYILA